MKLERIIAVVVAITSLVTALGQYRGKEAATQQASEYSKSADVIASTCVPALVACMKEKGTQ